MINVFNSKKWFNYIINCFGLNTTIEKFRCHQQLVIRNRSLHENEIQIIYVKMYILKILKLNILTFKCVIIK